VCVQGQIHVLFCSFVGQQSSQGQNAYACEAVLHHALHGRILVAEWKCAQRGTTHALHGHIVCSRVTADLLDTMMYPIMSGVCDYSIAASCHISIGATCVANRTSVYSAEMAFITRTVTSAAEACLQMPEAGLAPSVRAQTRLKCCDANEACSSHDYRQSANII
jgi:hypothetical protein